MDAEGALSETFRLREGASLLLSFRGNIDFTDKTPRKILFHSNLRTNKFSVCLSFINSTYYLITFLKLTMMIFFD